MNIFERWDASEIAELVVQSFLDLSRLYLDASEEFCTSNFSLARDVLVNTTTAINSYTVPSAVSDLKLLESNLAVIRAVASNRTFSNIAAEVQDELSKLNLTLAAFPRPISQAYDRTPRSNSINSHGGHGSQGKRSSHRKGITPVHLSV